ncbi:ferritin-like domain-containing protein [Brachymonas sp.]|uniref:ferritin-like domain-containing protein n=1 Tax=Brachymonas sp. TaxID=1936292 RepID=UPI0035ADB409
MLRALALDLLCASSHAAKVQGVLALDLQAPLDPGLVLQPTAPIPGREARPELVSPAQLHKRSVATTEGRAALLHALAHIEFNAIDLALDIVWRFPGMPEAFYRDWLGIAREEARHFSLLAAHLETLGYRYGDFPAHNGLWEMAEKTRDDLLARLALVPRTLEARGLDASPPIRDKLRHAGDLEAAAILDIILHDEIGHVAIGNRWYRHVCTERGLDPVAAYAELAECHGAPRLRGPYNREARLAAGFTPEELDALPA